VLGHTLSGMIVGKVALMVIAGLQIGTAGASAHMSKPTANSSCDVTAVFSWQGYSTASKAVVKMTDETTHFTVSESHAATPSGKLSFTAPAVSNSTKTTFRFVGHLDNSKGVQLAQASNSGSFDCIIGP
jgi:hypothetical protein